MNIKIIYKNIKYEAIKQTSYKAGWSHKLHKTNEKKI